MWLTTIFSQNPVTKYACCLHDKKYIITFTKIGLFGSLGVTNIECDNINYYQTNKIKIGDLFSDIFDPLCISNLFDTKQNAVDNSLYLAYYKINSKRIPLVKYIMHDVDNNPITLTCDDSFEFYKTYYNNGKICHTSRYYKHDSTYTKWFFDDNEKPYKIVENNGFSTNVTFCSTGNAPEKITVSINSMNKMNYLNGIAISSTIF
jgi:hypothetical protein